MNQYMEEARHEAHRMGETMSKITEHEEAVDDWNDAHVIRKVLARQQAVHAELMTEQNIARHLKHLLRRVIGEHTPPSDCFSTGPFYGDARDDTCPACEALRFLETSNEPMTAVQQDSTTSNSDTDLDLDDVAATSPKAKAESITTGT